MEEENVYCLECLHYPTKMCLLENGTYIAQTYITLLPTTLLEILCFGVGLLYVCDALLISQNCRDVDKNFAPRCELMTCRIVVTG